MKKASMKHGIFKILLAVAASLFCLCSRAQDNYDLFATLSKYIEQGNAEALSAWFAKDLDVKILSNGGESSRNQAKQMIKSFFDSYTPRSFEVTHTTGTPTMKYAMGDLNAGGESFAVTLFVTYKGNAFEIQQVKIDRVE